MKMRNIKCYLAGAVMALMAANGCSSAKVEEPTNRYIQKFEVKNTDWKLIGLPGEDGSYFSFTFNRLPLDIAYDDGVVTVYRYLIDSEANTESQLQLPSTDHYMVPGSDPPYYYTYQYDYAISRDGIIEFTVFLSDFLTNRNYPPPTMLYRVVIEW